MKVEPVTRLRPLKPELPIERPALEQARFEGERGKSLEALRKALEKGVGAEHKQAHSRRFGALLDEEV